MITSKSNKSQIKTKSRPRQNLHKDPKVNFYEGCKIWLEFWRKNPHRFAVDYLGFPLFTFQQILLYMMNISDYFVFIACRGLGKSYLTAVFCCVRCILYPGTKVVLASGNKAQAGLIISEKIVELRETYPVLNREIKEVKTNIDKAEVIFHNGSRIKATTSGDGSRGMRGNILIVDEYRLVKKENIDSVLKQFLTAPRMCPFMQKEEYKNYPPESNKELYLSSAWYKSHWSWDKFLGVTKRMLEGAKSFTCDIPYSCSIDHKLVLKEKIDEDRRDIGEHRFLMEYCGIWFGENENSFYKSDEINNCRVLKTAYYPLREWEWADEKLREKKLKQMPKLKGEIRILSCDIAIEGGKQNDNSVYTIIRMIPSAEGFFREVVYMESHNGLEESLQALRIKQLFYEFEIDKMIIDTNGNGGMVLTHLQRPQYDTQRDLHYEAFTVYSKNGDVDYDLSKGGLPVIYAIKGYAKLNNDIAVFLKNGFTSGKIRLLIDDNEKKMDCSTTDKRFNTDGDYSAYILHPFVQITTMVYEIINLEYEVRPDGNIVVKEVGKARKDRFSSIAYGNYLAELIEREEIKKNKKQKIGFIFYT